MYLAPDKGMRAAMDPSDLLVKSCQPHLPYLLYQALKSVLLMLDWLLAPKLYTQA